MDVLTPECGWPSNRSPASSELTPHRGLSVGHGADRRRTVLGFVGDLMLGRRVSSVIGAREPESFWGDVLPFLDSCDAVIGNLESPITTHDEPWRKTWKAFHFRAVPEATRLLTAANVQLVNLANNHIMDFGERGVAQTKEFLSAAGIACAGAGANMDEALTPTLHEVSGLALGFIGLTDNMPEWAAKGASGGVNYIAIRDDRATIAMVRLVARSLRNRGADCIVLSVHWGPNLRTRPTRTFRRFARRAIQEGVDIVHGHSAHLIQGVEFHHAGLILYDTGDFLNDYWVFPGFRTDRGALFVVELADGTPNRVTAVPVSLSPAQTNLARGKEFSAIQNCLARRCRALASKPLLRPWGVEIAAAAP